MFFHQFGISTPSTGQLTCRQLSDTTKSGKLLFPEFALAMYLCNLKLTGKDLPDKIPEKIMNEVSSMVDIISFGIPDNVPSVETRANVPNFEITAPSIQTPPAQPQQSNLQTLASLGAQSTGFPGYGTMSAPATGFPGRVSSQQGFSPQQTGFQPPTPTQPTGFQSTTTSLQYQYTGMPQAGGLSAGGITSGGFSALQSQPTGRPGQWGFVNAPAGSMAGIEALQQQLMPQPGRAGGFSSSGLQGTANIPWAVTKDEKTYNLL
jgi:actin cytoskeleton-regulatory complex protein PAN1